MTRFHPDYADFFLDEMGEGDDMVSLRGIVVSDGATVNANHASGEIVPRECTCHAPNPDSDRAARDAFDATMGEPLRLLDHMMAGLRGGR